MASISEILETEKQRGSVAQCRMAYLYREGGFMRAYAWSAWLVSKHTSEPLEVVTRFVKSVAQNVSMVGFPPKSLEKYAPKGAVIEPQIDGTIIVTLSAETMPDNTDIAALTSEYEEWLSKQTVKEAGHNKKGHDNPFDAAESEMAATPSYASSPHQRPRPPQPRTATFTSIMQQILAYPLEQKTPVENTMFIIDLKRQLLSFI